MAKKTLEDIDVKGKKVFVRADFNVPLDEKQNITNDKRIRATLPTIEYLLKQGAAVILASHLGRPKGKVVPEMSTKPVAVRLSELLGKPVAFAADCVGAPATEAAAKLQPGEVLLLENLRFHAEEEKNDPGFAKQLADLADVVVDDAFGCAHRGHASNEGITKYKETVAGYLIGKELDFIGKALEAP
ncbi:MAG: phosphoglycerate kinase, partial [Schwartzia sp.]|nr:phosphoglycerate kinase [Schwartzia sp. (in: firmicutes)]